MQIPDSLLGPEVDLLFSNNVELRGTIKRIDDDWYTLYVGEHFHNFEEIDVTGAGLEWVEFNFDSRFGPSGDSLMHDGDLS